jgi:hypothetical protein
MRAKTLKIAGLGLFALALVGSVSLGRGYAYDGSEAFDLQHINQSIRSALSDVYYAGSHVKDMSWQLDPSATDVEQDRYKTEVTLTVGGLGWTQAPVKVTGSLQIDAKASGAQGGKGLSGELEMAVATDSFALINGLSRVASCPTRESVTGFRRVVAQVDCRAIGKFAAAKTMEEVVTVFAKHLEEHKAAAKLFVTEATASLSGIQSEALRHQAMREIAEQPEVLPERKNA